MDELPPDDALALIESYQPDGRFYHDGSEAERDAAREIVLLLGCFTLAVESAAVYLGQFANDVTCAAFLTRLKKEGLEGLDTAAGQSSEGVLHGEKRLGATLLPTLERLGAAEKLALEFAALLPPDQVPLPWLRVLVAENFPELARDAEPGYPDPWRTVVRRLFSLRLLQVTDAMDEDGQPSVVRIHQLLQELTRTVMKADAPSQSAAPRMKQHLNRMSALFRWMMRGQLTGHNWEKVPVGEWMDARDWRNEALATFTSGIWSQVLGREDGFAEESSLCEIAIREDTIQIWDEIHARDFLLSQHLRRGNQRDENLPGCLVAYSELLEAYWKYGISSFSRSKLGFRCVDDILDSLVTFLRKYRSVKSWRGFIDWAAKVETVIEKTHYLSRRDWLSDFSALIESL